MIIAFVVFGFSAAAGFRLFNFLWDTFIAGIKRRKEKNVTQKEDPGA